MHMFVKYCSKFARFLYVFTFGSLRSSLKWFSYMPRGNCQPDLSHTRIIDASWRHLFGGPCSKSLASYEERPLFSHICKANTWEIHASRGWSFLINLEAESCATLVVFSICPQDAFRRGVFSFPVKCVALLISVVTLPPVSFWGSHSRFLALVCYLSYSCLWHSESIMLHVDLLPSISPS